MKNALTSLWTVFRALFMGVIGQPDGGTEPEARARKIRQQQRMEGSSPSGPLQAVGAMFRAAFYAVIFQPDNANGSRTSKRKPRR